MLSCVLFFIVVLTIYTTDNWQLGIVTSPVCTLLAFERFLLTVAEWKSSSNTETVFLSVCFFSLSLLGEWRSQWSVSTFPETVTVPLQLWAELPSKCVRLQHASLALGLCVFNSPEVSLSLSLIHTHSHSHSRAGTQWCSVPNPSELSTEAAF